MFQHNDTTVAMKTEDESIKEISEKSGTPVKEVEELISAKEEEFDGLVSRLGAIYIVGRELGVELAQPRDKELKIGNIISDMRRLNFAGKITDISPVREFMTKNGKGKVVNVTFADETGRIRMSLWNEETDAAEKLGIGEVFEITGAYTKADNLGNPEARLGKTGKMVKSERAIEAAAGFSGSGAQRSSAGSFGGNFRNSLASAEENDFVKTKASIVRVFERKPVYYLCPECRAKLEPGNDSCPEHGKVKPRTFFIVSGVIDDGTSAMNAAFFNEACEELIGKKLSEIEKDAAGMDPKKFADSFIPLGEELIIKGRVKKNKVSESLELAVRGVEKEDVMKEIDFLLSRMSAKESLSVKESGKEESAESSEEMKEE